MISQCCYRNNKQLTSPFKDIRKKKTLLSLGSFEQPAQELAEQMGHNTTTGGRAGD